MADFYHKQFMDYLRGLKDAVSQPEHRSGPVRVWDANTGKLKAEATLEAVSEAKRNGSGH